MEQNVFSNYVLEIIFNHKGKILTNQVCLNNCEKDAERRWKYALGDSSENLNFVLYHADENGIITKLKSTKEDIKEQYVLF